MRNGGTGGESLRSGAIAFLGWQELRQPNETQLNAAVNIVNGIRPKNEAEACLAAQIVAVHWMTMKMAGRAMQQSYPDPKTVAVASKLARTFSMQMDTLGQMRGRTGRQTVIVRKYEEHRHVHFDGDPGGRILEPEPMHQSEDGLQKTPRPSLTASRLANMAAAPRCQAKTRAGGSCRSAVVRGKARCRMHGGAKGSGGQRGKRNGVYKDGAWTNEAKAHTKQAQALIKRVRRLLMSYGIETTDSPTSS